MLIVVVSAQRESGDSMLTYEQFEKYLTAIIAADKKMDEICTVIGGADKLMEGSSIGTSIELLSKLMGDTDWIGYWIYEQNCGEEWDEKTASESDGTPIICKTMRQLYDFLIKNADYSNGMPMAIGKAAKHLPQDQKAKLKNALKDYCEVCDYINQNLVGKA